MSDWTSYRWRVKVDKTILKVTDAEVIALLPKLHDGLQNTSDHRSLLVISVLVDVKLVTFTMVNTNIPIEEFDAGVMTGKPLGFWW